MSRLSTDAIFKLDTAGSGARGRAEALLRQVGRRGSWPRQERLARAVRENGPTQSRDTRPRPVHPADVALETRQGRRGGVDRQQPTGRKEQGELSGADLLWIERLPTDPAAVTFEDAVRLANLAASVSRVDAPASHMLIQSLWEPVSLLHEEAVTRDELARLREPQRISAMAIDAAQEVIEAENPGLGAASAAAEASERANRFNEDQWNVYDQAKAKLQRRLEEVRARRAELNQTTRTTTSAPPHPGLAEGRRARAAADSGRIAQGRG